MTPVPSVAASGASERPARTAIILAGRVVVPAKDVEAFLADERATSVVAAAHPGNVMISFCLHDAAAGAVTMLERWASRTALDQYVATSQVSALFPQVGAAHAQRGAQDRRLQRQGPAGVRRTPGLIEDQGCGPHHTAATRQAVQRRGAWTMVENAAGVGVHVAAEASRPQR